VRPLAGCLRTPPRRKASPLTERGKADTGGSGETGGVRRRRAGFLYLNMIPRRRTPPGRRSPPVGGSTLEKGAVAESERTGARRRGKGSPSKGRKRTRRRAEVRESRRRQQDDPKPCLRVMLSPSLPRVRPYPTSQRTVVVAKHASLSQLAIERSNGVSGRSRLAATARSETPPGGERMSPGRSRLAATARSETPSGGERGLHSASTVTG